MSNFMYVPNAVTGSLTLHVDYFVFASPQSPPNYYRALQWAAVMTYITHIDPAFSSVFGIEAVNEPIMDPTKTPGYGDCEFALPSSSPIGSPRAELADEEADPAGNGRSDGLCARRPRGRAGTRHQVPQHRLLHPLQIRCVAHQRAVPRQRHRGRGRIHFRLSHRHPRPRGAKGWTRWRRPRFHHPHLRACGC